MAALGGGVAAAGLRPAAQRAHGRGGGGPCGARGLLLGRVGGAVRGQLRRLVLGGQGGLAARLDEDPWHLHAAAELARTVERAAWPDTIVSQRAPAVHGALLEHKDLLVGRGARLVLDHLLDAGHVVVAAHLQHHRATRERLDKDLHTAQLLRRQLSGGRRRLGRLSCLCTRAPGCT